MPLLLVSVQEAWRPELKQGLCTAPGRTSFNDFHLCVLCHAWSCGQQLHVNVNSLHRPSPSLARAAAARSLTPSALFARSLTRSALFVLCGLSPRPVPNSWHALTNMLPMMRCFFVAVVTRD